jgi:hypothetical protein
MGICLEVLEARKPLVALSNPDRYDHHQDDLLRYLEAQRYLIWCQELARLEQAIAAARGAALQPYRRPECTVHLHIGRFLNGLHRNESGTRLPQPSEAD